jgi:dienelactone hydrolase
MPATNPPRRLRLLFILGVLSATLTNCAYHPASFDLTAARRVADLAVLEVPNSERIRDGVTLREISFISTTWDGGTPRPIRIQAFIATPPGEAKTPKPGVIFAHGLGSMADPQTAIEISRNIDVVALVLSGPGLGKSEGTPVTPENSRPLFSNGKDIHTSWMYSYVFAILRAITVLQTRPEVDPQAIALTGFSLGGVATFIANGVDDRIRGALPVSASGHLLQAVKDETWLRALLQSSKDLKPEDAAPTLFFRSLDPMAYARRQHGAVYMLTGAQDEYFPLEESIETYRALRAPQKSLAIVPDYDHGWYFGGGCPGRCMPGSQRATDCPPAPTCPAVCPTEARPPYCGPQQSYNRQEEFTDRWALLLRSLVALHVARPPRPFAPPPLPPRLDITPSEVIVHSSATKVRLAVSPNCGFTYSQTPLERGADGLFHHPEAVPKDAIVIAEAEAADGAISTSIPSWPKSCKLHLRPFGARPQ